MGEGALLLAGATAVGGYLALVGRMPPRAWPLPRSLAWVAGVCVALLGVTGPVGAVAHHDFRAHMIGHLMVGMIAPLLLVAARPVTLLLRALPRRQARAVARALRSTPVRVVTNPWVAGVLDIGGLWLLYTSDLYAAMHEHPGVAILVHVHVLISGWVLTAVLIGRDPMPHRAGMLERSAVAVGALAAHDVLAKWVYAHPPIGVPTAQAETGAMLMYYGGDLVDVVLIVVLWSQWYGRAAGPSRSTQPPAAARLAAR